MLPVLTNQYEPGKDDGTVALIELSDGLVFSPNTKVFRTKEFDTELQSSSHSKQDKVNLNSMFDRETRREKVLEGLAKEARIKAASLIQNGMKSVVANVNLQSRLSQTGYEDIRRKAHGRSKKEELVEQLVEQAERSFYSSMKQVRDQRVRAGKPLQYSVGDH